MIIYSITSRYVDHKKPVILLLQSLVWFLVVLAYAKLITLSSVISLMYQSLSLLYSLLQGSDVSCGLFNA